MRFPLIERAADGQRYRIRPIRPDDAQRERDFIAALSPQSRYLRFMHALRELCPADVERLVNVDRHRTMALIAVTGEESDERIIGVARYAADNDTECEFAVAVVDDWHCHGIGARLTGLLFEYAAHEGFKIIYGRVLPGNQRMLELAEWLGLTLGAPRAGEREIRAWRRLDSPAQ
jgi:acetyltransferase